MTTGRSFGVIAFAAITLSGCGKAEPSVHEAGGSPGDATSLRISRLHGKVIRMGVLHGEPLYGVRVRAFVCSRSAAEADRTYPTSFRLTHHVTPGRVATHWRMPFRVMENELSWLVSLGETRGACGDVSFEDVIPPSNYGGLESPLGCLGYCRGYRCYGVRLTVRAALANRSHTAISASRRAIIQCGRFRPG